MPVNMEKYLNQILVYWEKEGISGSGQSKFKEPVEVLCRWDDITEEDLKPGSRVVEGNAFLLTEIKLKAQSMVWLAPTLTPGQGLVEYRKLPTFPKIPTTLQGGYEVMRVGANPAKDGSDLVFTARV